MLQENLVLALLMCVVHTLTKATEGGLVVENIKIFPVKNYY